MEVNIEMVNLTDELSCITDKLSKFSLICYFISLII